MADKTLDKNVLLNHEAMISFLNNKNPEMFETFVFELGITMTTGKKHHNSIQIQ